MGKRPIDRAREAAFFMEVGDESDVSPILEMIPVAGRMLTIKEQGIWQIQLADQVDPDRINPRIPNTQQKLMGRGTADPLVCRILLQACSLLKSEFLPDTCDTSLGIEAALSFLQDINELQNKADDFEALTESIKSACEDMSPNVKGLIVPAVGDVNARAKAFIQGSDHAVRSLWQLVRVFDQGLPVSVSWLKLKTRLAARDHSAQQVAEMIDRLVRGFAFLRNTRNAVEHPKPGQEVIIQDYRLKADGHIHPPAITVNEKDTPLPETDLGLYFAWAIAHLVEAFETLLINLCALNIKPFSGFETVVTKLGADQRRYPHLAFSYATRFGDRLVPYLN